MSDPFSPLEVQVDYVAILFRWIAAALYATFLCGRMVFSPGPGVSMSPAGLEIRRGLYINVHLPWSDIAGVSIKETRINWFIVIGLHDPEGYIASRWGVVRWYARKSYGMFGSPVCIPMFALKCDRDWLLQEISVRIDKFGIHRAAGSP